MTILKEDNDGYVTCKNCGHRFKGNYCNQCGQKSNVNRINFSSFLTEISETIFQINSGFFYTLKELTIRPGYSINEFLAGKRKSHFKPIAYLLLMSTLYFLITKTTGQNTWAGDLIEGWMIGAADLNSKAEIPPIATWFIINFDYLNLMLVPIFSIASYLSFITFRKTFFEHIVLNAYISGHEAIIYSFFIVCRSFIENEILEIMPFIMTIAYTFWAYSQAFSGGNKMINLLRTILTYLLYSILSFILLGTLMGLAEL